jgi:peptidylprolyl isomerase
MKSTALVLLLAAGIAAAGAQTAKKPATTAAKPATASHSTAATANKLPTGIPVVHGIVKPAFTLKYEDYKIGAGPLAEPNKLYHVHYTGYLAATGVKFDSSYDHRTPVMKDGKPVTGADGKPQLGEAEPLVFPQGFGRLIPGFDQGFAGMRVGGKRRLFIPWQLGYGTREIPARGAEHPGIPPKSDLVFDVELIDVTDMPAARPMGAMQQHPGAAPVPAHPGAPSQPGKPAAPAAPATAPAPPTTTAPAQPAAAPATPAPKQAK